MQMSNSEFKMFALPLLLAFVLAGCGTTASLNREGIDAAGQAQADKATEQSTPLAGTHWVIEKINGHAVIAKPPLTLEFGTEGTMGGYSGCNTYSGQYHLTREGLSIDFMASTAKACSLPAIEKQKDGSWEPSTEKVNLDDHWQEVSLINVVSHANSFDITAKGKLILRTGSGASLEATTATE